jgi:hypothetical protein
MVANTKKKTGRSVWGVNGTLLDRRVRLEREKRQSSMSWPMEAHSRSAIFQKGSAPSIAKLMGTAYLQNIEYNV